MEESKINTLVNIGQSKVIEKAYDDTISPLSKKAGQALSTIVDTFNTILLPLKWVNDKARIYFEANMKRYEENVNKIPNEEINEIPSEISLPILNRLSYVSNEELSNAFINLLSNASSQKTIEISHPGFISIIDRISADEAKILKYFSVQEFIPCIYIKLYHEFIQDDFKIIVNAHTDIIEYVKLTFPKSVDLYFDNLKSLGLIQENNYFSKKITERMNNFVNEYLEKVKHLKLSTEDIADFMNRIHVRKYQYSPTHFGKLFISACINDFEVKKD